MLRIANYSLTKRILANFTQALAFLLDTSFCQEKEVLRWIGGGTSMRVLYTLWSQAGLWKFLQPVYFLFASFLFCEESLWLSIAVPLGITSGAK